MAAPRSAQGRPAPGGAWRPALLALAAISAANLVAQPARALRSAEATDYVAFATGGRLAGSNPSCLYCLGAEQSAQTALLGHPPRIGLNEFVNLPLAAWVLRPLAGLSLTTGLALFLAISCLALLAAAVMLGRLSAGSPQRWLLVAAAVATIPGAEALAFGQWDPLVLAAVAGAMVLVRGGRDVEAGLVLSLGLVKPQVVWLCLPLLLLSRRWRAAVGFVAGAALWALTGLLISGGPALREWLTAVLPRHTDEGGKTVGIPAVLAAAHTPGLTAAAGVACGVAALVLAWRRRAALTADPATAVAFGVLASLAAAPHVFETDLMLAAPALVLLGIRHRAWAVTGMVALAAAHLVDSALGTGAGHTEAGVLLGLVVASLAAMPATRVTRATSAATGRGTAGLGVSGACR